MVGRDYEVAYNAVGASGGKSRTLALRCGVGYSHQESRASAANLGRPRGITFKGSVS